MEERGTQTQGIGLEVGGHGDSMWRGCEGSSAIDTFLQYLMHVVYGTGGPITTQQHFQDPLLIRSDSRLLSLCQHAIRVIRDSTGNSGLYSNDLKTLLNAMIMPSVRTLPCVFTRSNGERLSWFVFRDGMWRSVLTELSAVSNHGEDHQRLVRLVNLVGYLSQTSSSSNADGKALLDKAMLNITNKFIKCVNNRDRDKLKNLSFLVDAPSSSKGDEYVELYATSR